MDGISGSKSTRKKGKDSSLSSLPYPRSLQTRHLTPPRIPFSGVSASCKIMNMVESGNYWEAIANDAVAYEDLDSLLNLLDVEELDGNDFVGDWDIPIPSDVPLGPVEPSCKIVAEVVPKPTVADAEQKQVSNYGDGSISYTPQQCKFVEITEEAGKLETQSPVSVLENNGSCSTGKNLPLKFPNANTVRARSKRVRSSGSNPWLSMLPWFSSASTLKKTSSHANKDKESQKRLHLSIATQSRSNTLRKVERQCPVIAKKCSHCEVMKTPQWRGGPLGPKSLCNACGVRFRSGRLFPEYRPVASPTFVPSLHSNSHRKVMEMRKNMKHKNLRLERSRHHHNLSLSQ